MRPTRAILGALARHLIQVLLSLFQHTSVEGALTLRKMDRSQDLSFTTAFAPHPLIVTESDSAPVYCLPPCHLTITTNYQHGSERRFRTKSPTFRKLCPTEFGIFRACVSV